MKREKAIFRPDPFGLSAAKIASFFEELFAILGERPRETELCVELPEGGRFSMDVEKGEMVVLDASCAKREPCAGRGFIVEFPVPFVLGVKTRFVLSPVSGGRVRVGKG